MTVNFCRDQYMVYICIGLVLLADGAEALAFSIIMPAMSNEWLLSLRYQSILGSVYFMGVMLGAITGGFLGDYLGRLKAFKLSSILTGILGILAL